MPCPCHGAQQLACLHESAWRPACLRREQGACHRLSKHWRGPDSALTRVRVQLWCVDCKRIRDHANESTNVMAVCFPEGTPDSVHLNNLIRAQSATERIEGNVECPDEVRLLPGALLPETPRRQFPIGWGLPVPLVCLRSWP